MKSKKIEQGNLPEVGIGSSQRQVEQRRMQEKLHIGSVTKLRTRKGGLKKRGIKLDTLLKKKQVMLVILLEKKQRLVRGGLVMKLRVRESGLGMRQVAGRPIPSSGLRKSPTRRIIGSVKKHETRQGGSGRKPMKLNTFFKTKRIRLANGSRKRRIVPSIGSRQTQWPSGCGGAILRTVKVLRMNLLHTLTLPLRLHCW